MQRASSIFESTADLLDEGRHTQEAAEVQWNQAQALKLIGQFVEAATLEVSARVMQATALATVSAARTLFNSGFASLTAEINTTPSMTGKYERYVSGEGDTCETARPAATHDPTLNPSCNAPRNTTIDSLSTVGPSNSLQTQTKPMTPSLTPPASPPLKPVDSGASHVGVGGGVGWGGGLGRPRSPITRLESPATPPSTPVHADHPLPTTPADSFSPASTAAGVALITPGLSLPTGGKTPLMAYALGGQYRSNKGAGLAETSPAVGVGGARDGWRGPLVDPVPPLPPLVYAEGEPELANEKSEPELATEKVEPELANEKVESPRASDWVETELASEEGESLPASEEVGSPPAYDESEWLAGADRGFSSGNGSDWGGKPLSLRGSEKVGAPPAYEESELAGADRGFSSGNGSDWGGKDTDVLLRGSEEPELTTEKSN